MAGYGDIFSGGGGAIASLFGSDDAPKAVLNRFAAPTAKAGGKLSTDLLTDTNALSKSALNDYLALQPKFTSLAGQQEGILNDILSRRLAMDPNAILQNVGNTAFGFINPNVVDPLSRFDVNSMNLLRRARGLNPAAVDSTADRLRNARIASGRYYDVARDAYGALPNLVSQVYAQNALNDATAAGIVPQIANAWEGVAARPTMGVLNRIGAANASLGAGGNSIANINAATQGFKQPQNWADRIGAASQNVGQMVNGIASVAGGASGGGGSM